MGLPAVKTYDYIAIGSGSALELVSAIAQEHSTAKIAVVDKDDPGGICLTRGCIPSKILLYPAELVRLIEKAHELGVSAKSATADFPGIMERMRTFIRDEVSEIRKGLLNAPNIDYYNTVAEFTAPYTLKAGNTILQAKTIFLCTGSKPSIPPVKGLDQVDYHTSDTILSLTRLPEKIAIIGGGFIAAEYGHFFSAMGSEVTIIGRNPQFLPDEEPEISMLAKRELGKNISILTGFEVQSAEKIPDSMIRLVAFNRESGTHTEISVNSVLIATGRSPNTDILHPEKSKIQTDKKGWIVVNEYLESSQPGIWAFGDANGKYLFKHVANYETSVVYFNTIKKKMIKAEYHAVPHAVFTCPEIAGVGLKEVDAHQQYGSGNILIGLYRYEDTTKGIAMGSKDYFVKVIVEARSMKLLGAHIIGPEASVLIQELITLLNINDAPLGLISRSMHIHPALSEVVQRACQNLMIPDNYHHLLEEHYGITSE